MDKGPETYGDEALRQALEILRRAANIDYWNNLRRFSIPQSNSLGVPIPDLRRIARHVVNTKTLALELWGTGIHEAQILATMVFPPGELTMEDAGRMVEDIDSWDLCDNFAGNLVCNSGIALEAVASWHGNEGEFIRRAAFSIIAQLDKSKNCTAEDVVFFLECIESAATDSRNFVKKAVGWALRDIGKTGREYNLMSMETARKLSGMDSRSARWISRTAIRELSSAKIQKRLEGKA